MPHSGAALVGEEFSQAALGVEEGEWSLRVKTHLPLPVLTGPGTDASALRALVTPYLTTGFV